jgi:hypothetical protein
LVLPLWIINKDEGLGIRPGERAPQVKFLDHQTQKKKNLSI